MKTPVLHYDYWLGQRPDWRRYIVQGLKGDASLLRVEYLLLKGIAPSRANFLAAMYAYATEGQQVFMLGPKLQKLLGETDTSKVPLEFLKLPFNAFYIALADCDIMLFDGETGYHPATGIYVHLVDPDIPAITLCFWGRENENSKAPGDDSCQWVNLALPEAVSHTDEDGTAYVDLDAYVERLFSEPHRDESDPGTVRNNEKHWLAAKALARLAFNLVLYVNSETPDKTSVAREAPGRKAMLERQLKGTKKPKKKARIQRQLDAISEARVVWLGKRIEESPEIPDDDADSSTSATGRKIRRHRRRGHWHHYWTGTRVQPDGTRRKGEKAVLRWVQPRWVGSDIGSLLNERGTTYKFRVEKSDHDRPEGTV